jgi:alcohol dehydrogenase
MKALVIKQHGDLDQLSVEHDWPTPTAGDGQVLLKVHATALNYHDLFTLKGMPGIKVPMPVISGMDVAGEIVALGAHVEGWKEGDRVMVDPLNQQTTKLLGEMTDGGLAQFCVVDAHMLVNIPDEVSYREAAALPVAYGTAYRMVVTRGQIRAGEKVLILGASGGVGTCCVQLAKMAGAHVIAAASSDDKLERLKAIGADEGINYKRSDFMTEVVERHGKPRAYKPGGGIDVVINFTGGETWVPSLKVLKKGGRMLTCGATAGFDPKTDIRYIWSFELDIRGSNVWAREDLSSLLDLVRQRKLEPVVDTVLSLEEGREAFRLLQQRNVVGKVIVEPWR